MEPQRFIDTTKERFATEGWRFTAGVRNLTHILAETKKPLAIADFVNELDKQDKSIDVATVYRIMERLEKIRMAKRVIGKYMPTSDPSNDKESEHFLICARTGEAESIFLDYHSAIAKQLKKEKNFTLEATDITFFGRKDYVA